MVSCSYFIQVLNYQFQNFISNEVQFSFVLNQNQCFIHLFQIFTEKEQHAKQLDAFYSGFAGTQNNVTDGQCMVFANVRSEDSRDRRAYTKLCKSK